MSIGNKILKLGRVRVDITIIAVSGATTIAFLARKYFGVKVYSPLPTIYLEKKARKLATCDMLTDLLSRRGFLVQADILYKIISRNRSSLVLSYYRY